MDLKCLVLEDDPIYQKIVQNYIERTPGVELVNVYTNSSEAIESGKSDHADLLIVDVEMPDFSGIEFVQMVNASGPVIVISSNKEYGPEAFEINAIDYLHKPFSYRRFKLSIEKATKYLGRRLDEMPREEPNQLFVKVEGLWHKIELGEISYIKASNNNVVIKTAEKRILANIKLKDILDKLPVQNFCQVHRSYVVNLQYIDKLDSQVLEIEGRNIPISRTFQKELYNRLNIQ